MLLQSIHFYWFSSQVHAYTCMIIIGSWFCFGVLFIDVSLASAENGIFVSRLLMYLLLFSYCLIWKFSMFLFVFWRPQCSMMHMDKSFLIITVKFFSVGHIPYAVVAIIMLLLFNITLVILLCLYPCQRFQQCLNHCPCQLKALRTFMDAFQGSFKTAPYDGCYFAATYLLFTFFAWASLQNSLYVPLIGILFLFYSLVVS